MELYSGGEMAVLHRSWKLDLQEARQTLAGLQSMNDLRSPVVTQRVRRVIADPGRRDLLVMARLDPRYRESRDALLDPTPVEFGFERAASDRLTVLLAGIAVEARALDAPYVVESHLTAGGWSPEEVNTAVRGHRMSALLAQLCPELGASLATCDETVVGGWLDRGTASQLGERLAAERATLEQMQGKVAKQLAGRSGLDIGVFEEKLRAGLLELDRMLTQTDETSVLWIIQD
jgi:hypothetical protein